MPKHYEKYRNKQEIVPDPKELTETYKGGIRMTPPKKSITYAKKKVSINSCVHDSSY